MKRSRESYVSWVALAAAFSPVLVDLARNLAASPEDRVTLLAPLLLVLALRASVGADAPPHRDGLLWIGAGIFLQLFGILVEAWSVARIGLPIAAVGLARFAGRPPVAFVALLLFAIPVPDTLVNLFSPALEKAIAAAASAILHALGTEIETTGMALAAAGRRIVLDPTDGGANLAVALAAIGWYAAASAGNGMLRCMRNAVAFGLATFPLQILGVVATGWILAAGMPVAARFWLRHGIWMACSAALLAIVHRNAIGALWRADQRPARSSG